PLLARADDDHGAGPEPSGEDGAYRRCVDHEFHELARPRRQNAATIPTPIRETLRQHLGELVERAGDAYWLRVETLADAVRGGRTLSWETATAVLSAVETHHELPPLFDSWPQRSSAQDPPNPPTQSGLSAARLSGSTLRSPR